VPKVTHYARSMSVRLTPLEQEEFDAIKLAKEWSDVQLLRKLISIGLKEMKNARI
jgi:hypothetical protein